MAGIEPPSRMYSGLPRCFGFGTPAGDVCAISSSLCATSARGVAGADGNGDMLLFASDADVVGERLVFK